MQNTTDMIIWQVMSSYPQRPSDCSRVPQTGRPGGGTLQLLPPWTPHSEKESEPPPTGHTSKIKSLQQSAIVTFGFAKMSLVLLEMKSVEHFHPVWALNQAETRNGGFFL